MEWHLYGFTTHFWRRIRIRSSDIQLFRQVRHLEPDHAGVLQCSTTQCSLHTACALQENTKSMITDPIIMRFTGRFAPIFSNLFEILYICVMCVAPAVAFATGGATLSTLTGLPYLFCTFLIGVFIFVVAILRDRSGAESSFRTVHLYYRGTAESCIFQTSFPVYREYQRLRRV